MSRVAEMPQGKIVLVISSSPLKQAVYQELIKMGTKKELLDKAQRDLLF